MSSFVEDAKNKYYKYCKYYKAKVELLKQQNKVLEKNIEDISDAYEKLENKYDELETAYLELKIQINDK